MNFSSDATAKFEGLLDLQEADGEKGAAAELCDGALNKLSPISANSGLLFALNAEIGLSKNSFSQK